ncbi:hypothetical protein MKJ01_18685 [Chryseobacterium sp. SSA4.19]|uniref:hypothetical protein n=1 Tax=Chryseobacterium sp. SSA4.19 TaxID=2919915 RepID=UPI001F4DD6D8|nr:hypothetical protein [Chryseobacterium sp. SSA4.19]MCJ8155780.1 hypothetical protein [Chryseobacterium sp. SSA4.19]
MKVFAILIFLLFSCGKNSKDDVIIHPVVDKKNSMLLLKIQNNTDQDLVIEYPDLEDFPYKDELEANTPEIIYTKKSFEVQGDPEDLSISRNSDCIRLKDIMNSNFDLMPKFIKKNSEKTYYLKFTRYRTGKTLYFEDWNFDSLFLSHKNRQKLLEKVKSQNCSGYRYYTGNISFDIHELTLE